MRFIVVGLDHCQGQESTQIRGLHHVFHRVISNESCLSLFHPHLEDRKFSFFLSSFLISNHMNTWANEHRTQRLFTRLKKPLQTVFLSLKTVSLISRATKTFFVFSLLPALYSHFFYYSFVTWVIHQEDLYWRCVAARPPYDLLNK